MQTSHACSHASSQALLKLNRKLQPMVDEMDANRNKWQDLCLSESRRASLTNQSADLSENPESCENREDSEHGDVHVQDTTRSPDETTSPESRSDIPT